jgi:hypothetical protein
MCRNKCTEWDIVVLLCSVFTTQALPNNFCCQLVLKFGRKQVTLSIRKCTLNFHEYQGKLEDVGVYDPN